MSYWKRYRKIAALLAFAALVLAVPLAAQAAGTSSGTQIGNTATVLYSVGGITQPQVTSGPSATFTVDNKVNLTVVANTANVTVVPGSTNQVLSFLVRNDGNTQQRYGLNVVSRATDSFDMTLPFRIYLDANSNGVVDGGELQYVNAGTFGNLVSDASFTILIVADTPAPLANGSIAVQDLVATTYDAGSLLITAQTITATTGVDVVFADIAGSAAGDNARDGKHSASATFTVSAAAITVTKSSAIRWDPFNLFVEPKAIPGAIITYTILVSNATGGGNATNVTVSDNLTGSPVTFVPTFDDGAPTCSGTNGISVYGVCQSNASDGDYASYNLGTNTVTVSGLTITAGTSAEIKFQVTIN